MRRGETVRTSFRCLRHREVPTLAPRQGRLFVMPLRNWVGISPLGGTDPQRTAGLLWIIYKRDRYTRSPAAPSRSGHCSYVSTRNANVNAFRGCSQTLQPSATPFRRVLSEELIVFLPSEAILHLLLNLRFRQDSRRVPLFTSLPYYNPLISAVWP